MSDEPQLGLSRIESQPQPLARTTPRDPLDMLEAMIAKGVTAENAAAFEQLVKLSEHMEDRKAAREFAEAFNLLQGEMKAVKAMKPVPNSDGTVRYKFAPYEEIMRQTRPLLEKHGFTVCFSTDFQEGRLIKECTLQHRGGHSKSSKFAVRVGKGPPGSSESQADGAASTYAKRFALCDSLNILIETDSDARIEGDPTALITAQQAKDLETRIDNCNGSKADFLKLAKAASFAEIQTAKLEILEEMLARKERAYVRSLEGKK